MVDIDTLRQDTHNFNRGTEEGQQLMERSFKELGAGRSILLDREGNIIAGNKSQQAARKAGIKKVRVIETTGGLNTDSGATNRKLGSDMGDGVTGGGLHGKDLSKCDVSVNIVCFLKAVHSGQIVTAICSIGDENVTFMYASGDTETIVFSDVVEQARMYILTDCGGFERFSEWGLIRP